MTSTTTRFASFERPDHRPHYRLRKTPDAGAPSGTSNAAKRGRALGVPDKAGRVDDVLLCGENLQIIQISFLRSLGFGEWIDSIAKLRGEFDELILPPGKSLDYRRIKL